MARVFFSVDVHGSCALWRKWLRAPEFYKADVLMLCGDLTGKMLVPLIQQPDGSYVLRFWKRKFVLRTEDEIREMEERLKNSGVYPFRATPEEIEELKANPDKVNQMMTEAIVNRMREWLDMILEHVDLNKVEVYVMPGNDDIWEIDDVIKEYEDRGIAYLLDKVVEIGGIETISMAEVNPTPWDTPRELPEKDLAKKIKNLVNKLSDPSQSIFNFHCPPYNTKLDLAPKLDKTLKPVTVGGVVQFEHVGSKAVREAELKYQPLMGLHGYIHESCAVDRLGKTVVVNPGSEYEAGILRAFIVEVTKEGVQKYWRVEG